MHRFLRAACLGFFMAALVPHGACGGPVQIDSARQCSDDSFSIDLTEMEEANIGQDPAERLEQLRDWLWPLLLARLEATTDLEGLLVGSATQPLIRDDALAHVLDLHVGSTRSGIAKDGTVVVMVQDADETAMLEALLEAIDQEAMHLGKTPQQVVVYRYVIDERAGYAHLCPFGTFDAGWIKAQGHGFRRATVRTTRDLEWFLDGGVDLLSAQCTEQGLEITGRSRPRARNAPITVDHVAPLYHPPITNYVPSRQLGVSLADFSTEEQQWFSDMAFHFEAGGAPNVEPDDDAMWAMFFQFLRWQQRYPEVAASELLLSWVVQRQAHQDPGFSLDPKIRASEAAGNLELLLRAFKDPLQLAALLDSWNVEPNQAAGLVQTIEMFEHWPDSFREHLLALQRELASSSDHEALGVLLKARDQERPFFAAAANLLEEHSVYQCARYDGPLQGTHTGMTMFYTDLLMKVWAGDRFDSAPEELIPGFESVAGHELSSAYCSEEESKYPSTRAWLGLRDEQYTRPGIGHVRFAPVVTRVFARGSQYGAGYGEEVEANARMRRFYQWWNAHYARVAAWEPQYELLNQIMKWSVVTQMAALSEHQDCLRFLNQVPVERGQRFDQWIDKHEELRWRGPVPLLQRDDEPTECLPLLRSRWFPTCGGEMYLTGGVSAASKATVASKRVMKQSRAPQLSRIEAMSSGRPKVSYGGRVKYDSITRPDGTLRNVELDPARRSFRAKVDAGQSQRGARHHYGVNRGGERQPVTGLKNERGLHQGRLGASDEFDASDTTIGVAHLQADDVTGPMLRPQVTPGPAAQMRSIGEAAARRLADGTKSLPEVAPDLSGVANAYGLPENRVLLELTGSSTGVRKYALMSSSGGNRGPPALLTGRYGGPGNQGGRGMVEISLISDEAARPMLAQATKLMRSHHVGLAPIRHALDAGDLARAEQAIADTLARGGERVSVNATLARAHRHAVRQGMDTSGIEALQLRTSIKYGKPHAPVRESNVLPADGTEFLVPRARASQYVDLANLPPGQSPVLRPGVPRYAFSARAVDGSSRFSNVPSVVRVDGVDYVRLQRPGGMARGVVRTVYIIEPCHRAGEGRDNASVACHGRTTAR
jgi:hypothetical protein